VVKKSILLERGTPFPKSFVKAVWLDASRRRWDYAGFLACCRHI